MEMFEIPFDAVRALAKIADADRPDFVIDYDGTRINWPKYDIDLGLDSLVAAVDPDARAGMHESALLRDRHLGTAIRKVRRRHSLRPWQIPGLSEQQIRRIEQGESRPAIATFELLAEAHRMSVPEYLDKVAHVASAEARCASTEQDQG